MTANFNALKSIRIQKEVGDGFITLPEEKLKSELRRLGHRFPNKRAEFICENRKLIKKVMDMLRVKDSAKIREWLVKNVKGYGYKEASHFMRNIGFKDVAIVDFHIKDLLSRYGLLPKGIKLNNQNYFKAEKILRRISEKAGLSLSELDLYLWFIETGRVLK